MDDFFSAVMVPDEYGITNVGSARPEQLEELAKGLTQIFRKLPYNTPQRMRNELLYHLESLLQIASGRPVQWTGKDAAGFRVQLPGEMKLPGF